MTLTRKLCIFTLPSAVFSHVVCVFNQLLYNRSGWFSSRRVYSLLTVCKVLTVRLIMQRGEDLIEMVGHLCYHMLTSAVQTKQVIIRMTTQSKHYK